MPVDSKLLFILLIVFQLKQCLADFYWQSPYMLNKVRPGWDFVYPLSLHCLVHAVCTFVICLWARPEYWWLAAVDFAVHFSVDRFRSSPRILGRYNDYTKSNYWWILGADQMTHHLTHIAFVGVILYG
jgi:hypothetical protein